MDTAGFPLPQEDFETDPASQVAVIVAAPVPDEAAELLHRHGWDVRHCLGPDETACPLVEGTPCPLRERSDGAIVYVDAAGAPDLRSAAAMVMCAGHRSSPAVAVISGDPTILDPLERVPVFRSDVGAETIVDAMETAVRATAE